MNHRMKLYVANYHGNCTSAYRVNIQNNYWDCIPGKHGNLSSQ